MGSSLDWIRNNISRDLNGFAVDLPGHGKSLDLSPEAYQFTNVAGLLRESLLNAGVSEMDLVGYSMGGRIALGFTRRFPDMVRHLVLESTSPGLVSHQERKLRAELDAERAEQLRSDQNLFQREWLDMDLFSSLRTRTEIRDMLIRERSNGSATEWARALESLSPAEHPDFRSWLARTSTTATCITGALDRKYTRIACDLNRKNKRIRHISVQDAGHNVHLEQPGMYLRILQEILIE